MPYQFSGLSVLDDFLLTEPDHDVRVAVLTFLMGALQDPTGPPAVRRAGPAPMYLCLVPGTDVAVTYFHAEQFKTVLLKRIERIPTL